jgi:hypothetical protein
LLADPVQRETTRTTDSGRMGGPTSFTR